MKVINYKAKGFTEIFNPETKDVEKHEILVGVSMPYSEANEEIAKREAYNGEYTVEDDGIEEIQKPTWQDKIEAQVAYNSMMLGTLIEEV